MSETERAPLGWINAARARLCPGCGAPDLLPGPRGGASQNFYCTQCRQGWNFHGIDYGIVDVDPIGLVNDGLVEFYLGVAAGEEARRAQLKADGLSDAEVEEMLAITRHGMPFPPMRTMLKGDGFTDQEIDELFAFAQIVEPSGNVVRVTDATLPELRGLMRRLFRKDSEHTDEIPKAPD